MALLAACGTEPKRADAPPKLQPDPLKIAQFYVSPNVVAPGGEAQVCYGTEGAVAVKITPGVEAIRPSLARCVVVHPAATATYTLTAEGSAGEQAQAVATLRVDPKARTAPSSPPMIQFLWVSSVKVPRGGKVTVCYGVQGAASVSLRPFAAQVPNAPRSCLDQVVARTLDVELAATGPAGQRDVERITITAVDQ